jgi:hypothetical protein
VGQVHGVVPGLTSNVGLLLRDAEEAVRKLALALLVRLAQAGDSAASSILLRHGCGPRPSARVLLPPDEQRGHLARCMRSVAGCHWAWRRCHAQAGRRLTSAAADAGDGVLRQIHPGGSGVGAVQQRPRRAPNVAPPPRRWRPDARRGEGRTGSAAQTVMRAARSCASCSAGHHGIDRQ